MYPDFDTRSSSSTQPVTVGAEAKGVDCITATIKGVQVLALIEVPEHGLSVLSTGGTQGTIGRHGHRVEVTAVSMVVRLQLAVGQIPNLQVTRTTLLYFRQTGKKNILSGNRMEILSFWKQKELLWFVAD